MLNPLVRRMLVVFLAGTSALLGAADYYKLSNTKRLDQDMYRSGEFIVETRNCDHLTIGEEALLKYEGPGEYAIRPHRAIRRAPMTSMRRRPN